ncbi:MAG: EscU/YscU/HrcU family type III secretion system export apparatus switch protein [Alphaproteobacteria bacterium]|nr:EscU/YscU/HrcU family type III secretion system export apparatus switch protein [Alphaproteobacteria bacterium]
MADRPTYSSSNKPEKQQKAVALEYVVDKDSAPRITASGQGNIAEQILQIAFANDIKVREDADLVEILSVMEVDSVIPLEAYAAVGEILTYVYKANAQSARLSPAAPRKTDSIHTEPAQGDTYEQ